MVFTRICWHYVDSNMIFKKQMKPKVLYEGTAKRTRNMS